MTTSFSVSKDDVIKAALQCAGVLAAGESPGAQDTLDITVLLQSMLKYWAEKGLKPWCYRTISWASTGASSYTVGPTGVVTPDRPIRILQAWVRDTNNNDQPLGILEKQRFDILTPKTQTGTPNSIFYDAQIPNGVMYPWPIPAALATSGLTFYTSIQKSIEDLGVAGNSTFDLPQMWYLPLIWNLAEQLIPGWPVEERTAVRIERNAAKYLEDVADFGEEQGSIFMQPSPQGSYYNGRR
jgi:hypothetical protein